MHFHCKLHVQCTCTVYINLASLATGLFWNPFTAAVHIHAWMLGNSDRDWPAWFDYDRPRLFWA